jgi:hypothetical protein
MCTIWRVEHNLVREYKTIDQMDWLVNNYQSTLTTLSFTLSFKSTKCNKKLNQITKKIIGKQNELVDLLLINKTTQKLYIFLKYRITR